MAEFGTLLIFVLRYSSGSVCVFVFGSNCNTIIFVRCVVGQLASYGRVATLVSILLLCFVSTFMLLRLPSTFRESDSAVSPPCRQKLLSPRQSRSLASGST